MEQERKIEIAVALVAIACIIGILICYVTYERRTGLLVDRTADNYGALYDINGLVAPAPDRTPTPDPATVAMTTEPTGGT